MSKAPPRPGCPVCHALNSRCPSCTRKRRNALAREARRTRDEVYSSLGMRKVRGAMGGTYYE